MSCESPLHRLATQCPRCGRRPPVRITREALEPLSRLPANVPVLSFSCTNYRGGNGRCGTLWQVRAAELRMALDRLDGAPAPRRVALPDPALRR